MPTYSLNTYYPAIVKPATGVAPFPKTGIDVAIRFVCHLSLDAVNHEAINQGNYKVINYPRHLVYHMQAADDYGALKRWLLRDMEGMEKSEGDDVTSWVLFGKAFKDVLDWDLQLWVMPQSPKLRKMFRYPTGKAGSTDQLHEFLESEMVVKDDRRLYIEAHVVAA